MRRYLLILLIITSSLADVPFWLVGIDCDKNKVGLIELRTLFAYNLDIDYSKVNVGSFYNINKDLKTTIKTCNYNNEKIEFTLSPAHDIKHQNSFYYNAQISIKVNNVTIIDKLFLYEPPVVGSAEYNISSIKIYPHNNYATITTTHTDLNFNNKCLIQDKITLKIDGTQEIIKNDRLWGKYIQYDSDKIGFISYYKGIKNGPYKKMYPKYKIPRTVRQIGTYKDGKLHGIIKTFKFNGDLLETRNFIHGIEE
ncbi:MAG: hypothetical protein HOL44_05845 [Campylobacteraceae bacterium]|jgi:hypothetical protein|nr:hypothetical protein [Campylobacteraceae bacterium]MBT5539842.1 hypothetical protein [Candidatus Neomarinimicrobiota bacterium]